MQITFDTNSLSASDIALLSHYVEKATATPEPEVVSAPAPEPVKAEPKKAPAKKAAAPKPEPEPEPEPEVEDLLGTEEAAATYTMEDAINLATELVSAGKQADVKAALESAGAARVSALTASNIAAFMKALS